MVHRTDTTLFIDGSGTPLFDGGDTICAAPRLRQGEAFLERARAIAWALSGARRKERVFSGFCDHCGVGLNCDNDGMPLPTVRNVRNWTCPHCDHRNIRDSEEKGA